MKKIFVLVALAFFACSDDSSSEATVNAPSGENSGSELFQSSSSIIDTFVEYVEPPTLSCETVESIPLNSEEDTSYYFYSFAFYGEDMVAIPPRLSMYGYYGYDDAAPIDTFYVKKNGSIFWEKRAAFDHYWYYPKNHKLCVVGKTLAIVRASNGEDIEICHSNDAISWTCDSLAEETFLTCDDKYFYKGEKKSGTLAYSENAIDWTPIDFKFEAGIFSLHETFSSDSARIIVVGYNRAPDLEWRTALLHSKDMISWDTTDIMYGLAWGAARLGDVYVLEIGTGGFGKIYYSKDLKNWNAANQVNGNYRSNTGIHETSTAVSNGVMVIVGTYGYILTSRNGKDFRMYKGACGNEKDYSSVIADSFGNFYALHSYPGKYEILRVVE